MEEFQKPIGGYAGAFEHDPPIFIRRKTADEGFLSK
jgi:hypothetical protein